MPNHQKTDHHTRRRIDRLSRQIDRFQTVSRRYSWLRLILFLSGAALTAGLTFGISEGVGLVALIQATIAFTVAVVLHRRVLNYIDNLTAFRQIQREELARLQLDWTAIPRSPAFPLDADHPFARDWDIAGPRSLHTLLDTTVTHGGSRRLLDWLILDHPDSDAAKHRQQAAMTIRPLLFRWDRIRLRLRQFSGERLAAQSLTRWASRELHVPNMRARLAVAGSLTGANALLFLMNRLGDWPPFWIIGLLLWMIYFLFETRSLSHHFNLLADLDDELSPLKALFRGLETLAQTQRPGLDCVLQNFSKPGATPTFLLHKIKMLAVAVGLRQNPMMALLLNLALPWDFICARTAEKLETAVHHHFPGWLDSLYTLEALAALAAASRRQPTWTFPTLNAADGAHRLKADALGHPLIAAETRVTNDYHLDRLGRIDLITGSNMAGKSTFLRTVGINLVLAYAGAPVCAQTFETTPFRLFSSMRITDSLADNTSTFYAEVKRLKALLEAIETVTEAPVFFFVDEIFRGTNNRERLQGSRAFLKAVAGKPVLGMVSTHDLDLTRLSATLSGLRNHHFKEHIQDSQLVFDYTLQPGPCPSTNALIIMKQAGLPVE